MKYFTPEEADALIPELEKIFEAVAELAAKAEVKAAALRARERSGEDDPAASAIDRGQLQFLAQAINERLQTIAGMGASPKGVDPALVDFPSRLDGRDVYLCWKLGEKRVEHWHPIEEGFGSRKPLPRRPQAR